MPMIIVKANGVGCKITRHKIENMSDIISILSDIFSITFGLVLITCFYVIYLNIPQIRNRDSFARIKTCIFPKSIHIPLVFVMWFWGQYYIAFHRF